LQDLKRERKKEVSKNGWGSLPEWVFTNEDGNMIHGDNWRKLFCRALDRAELRRIRVHDMRYTYASLLIQAGESLAYIRDQLGHCTIQVTESWRWESNPQPTDYKKDGVAGKLVIQSFQGIQIVDPASFCLIAAQD
jgi:integrase